MLRSGKELEEQRSKHIEMKEEEEIETKLSTKKKHPPPPPPQIKTTTNTPTISPHSMNSNFMKIPPFPVSSSRSMKEDRKRDFRGFQESGTQYSFDLCYQTNFQVFQILEGVVYYQESLQAQKPRNGKYERSCICCCSNEYAFEAKRPRYVYYPMCYW
jgi:hypothetical protein